MRTLLQLNYETFIQLSVQIWMLITLTEEDAAEFGLNQTSLLISVVLSIVHILFESILLYCESQACKTTLYNYCV